MRISAFKYPAKESNNTTSVAFAGEPAEIKKEIGRLPWRTLKEVTSVTDEYLTEYYDFADHAAPYGSDHMSSEERRLQSLRNLAQSRAAKARKKQRKQSAEPAERKITEAERRELEQARIREERQTRGALSEENRRLAAVRAGAPQQEEKPQKPQDAPPPADEPKDSDIDIALPAEHSKKKRAENKSKQKKKTKQTEKPSRAAAASRYVKRSAAASNPNRITTGGAVTLGILTGVLIGTVIYGRVQTNEVYTEIAALQAEYDDLVARNVSMKSEMEGKMTVKNIEEYATEVLGLMPLNQSQIEYIRLQTEDAVVISEPEDNFFVLINDYLVGIWEFLRGK